MAYIPDPTNVDQPADVGVQAATAAAEFRALKQYIQTTVIGSGGAGLAGKVSKAGDTMTGTLVANGGIDGVPDLLLKSSGTTKVWVKASGDVGIGDSAPAHAGVDRALSINGATSAILDLKTGNDLKAYLHASSTITTLGSPVLPLSFYVGGPNRLYIDALGRVGIGFSAPEVNLQLGQSGSVLAFGSAASPTVIGNQIGGIVFSARGAAENFLSAVRAYVPAGSGGIDFTDLRFYTSNGGTALNAERMRIDAAGRVLVHTVDAGDFQGGASVLKVERGQLDSVGATLLTLYGAGDAAGGYGITSRLLAGNTQGWHQKYFAGDMTVAGGIYQNSVNTVQRFDSSDASLKQNIVDAPDAGAIIDAIRVRSYDWINGGNHEIYGLVAQELQAHAPGAVYEPTAFDLEHGGVWGVDPTKLIPLMLKEIQSLRLRVAALGG
jgi:hypothetical protein